MGFDKPIRTKVSGQVYMLLSFFNKHAGSSHVHPFTSLLVKSPFVYNNQMMFYLILVLLLK